MDKKEQKKLVVELMSKLQEVKKDAGTGKMDSHRPAKFFKPAYPIEKYLTKTHINYGIQLYNIR